MGGMGGMAKSDDLLKSRFIPTNLNPLHIAFTLFMRPHIPFADRRSIDSLRCAHRSVRKKALDCVRFPKLPWTEPPEDPANKNRSRKAFQPGSIASRLWEKPLIGVEIFRKACCWRILGVHSGFLSDEKYEWPFLGNRSLPCAEYEKYTHISQVTQYE